jgi:hypothetical protein
LFRWFLRVAGTTVPWWKGERWKRDLSRRTWSPPWYS